MRSRGIPESRDDNDGREDSFPAHDAQHFAAVHTGKSPIEHGQRVTRRAHFVESLVAGARMVGNHLMLEWPRLAEVQDGEFAVGVVVVDNQHPKRACAVAR
ncbi:MAG: hypothetical protein ABSG14_02250 [Verrucomicrobiia bacterium]|jgi:hypothetical protein